MAPAMRLGKPLVFQSPVFSMEFSEKHAEFVGMHFGDGSLTQRKGTDRLRFQLRGDAVSDRAHYESFVIPLCNELIGFPFLGKEVVTVHDRKLNSFGVSVERNTFFEFFSELGIPIGVKKELKVPDWILENESFSKAFIRGLFDTDGGISYQRNYSAKIKTACCWHHKNREHFKGSNVSGF